jgi:transposase
MFSIDNLFEQALNVCKPWYITNIEFSDKEKRLDIYIDFKKGSSFFYESSEENINGNYKVHDTINKTWRHLNFFEHETYLHARVPRIKTDNNKIRKIKVPWEGLHGGFTLLFEAFMLKLASNMPVNIVSKLIQESNYKIWKILEKYVDATLILNEYSELTAIGMDETSSKKGHNILHCLLT